MGLDYARSTTGPNDFPTERNRALIEWYHANRRDLPWRGTTDPYLVLVSEVMLQQTQAARVVPFFDRFVSELPTVEHLAAAPLGMVLALWNGLGYNSRAKRLHDAAGMIAVSGWPESVEGLMALPGVGDYTARAVACFAWGLDVVPVDTNVRRVLGRWHGEPLGGASLRQAADQDTRDAVPAEWAQAVMDLGSALCSPRRPACGRCPVASWCAGPEIYVPPGGQTRFEGSMRQLRGSIVRRLVDGAATFSEVVEGSGFDPGDVSDALEALESEGLVTAAGSRYRLPR